MASRYASFTRSARSAMHHSSRRGPSSSFRPSNPKPTSFTNPSSASTRRRWAMSLIPLHNAVADAKLVSHLSVTSRNCSALALGLQGFIDAELHTFGVRSPRANRALSIVLDKFSAGLQGFIPRLLSLCHCQISLSRMNLFNPQVELSDFFPTVMTIIKFQPANI
ncbi:uncharacterized protein LOC131028328 isoform X2 [Cryptomeria japonica]|uniref:uncharacterized protein LOC131028328 isoform X2 n=1 Tax=Cryptomeria japonica TaxID=3369 RepID=UPI0025AB97C2|nr:uncharacterized protein LOC131028328 isoform X2 [Cryptomeria japonica]XP_057814568.1 uncharacterized protein LOC131028328 isoform X2 [Cryptomeria japonica]